MLKVVDVLASSRHTFKYHFTYLGETDVFDFYGTRVH